MKSRDVRVGRYAKEEDHLGRYAKKKKKLKLYESLEIHYSLDILRFMNLFNRDPDSLELFKDSFRLN